MFRRLSVCVLVLAGCRTPPPPPRPTPPQRFESAGGLRWDVRDGRDELASDERPLPVSTLTDSLRRTTTDDLGPDRPERVELTVASYTQATRRRAIGGPAGDYSPVFMHKETGLNVSSGDTGGFWLGALGLLELLWAGVYAGWSAAAAADQTRAELSPLDPGVTCRLTGTAVLVWADGRRVEQPIDAYGSVDRGPDEKKWGPAVQAAQTQVAAGVWQQVWQTVRPDQPPAPPPALPPPGPVTPRPPQTPAVPPPPPTSFADLLSTGGTHVPVRPPAGAAPPNPAAGAGRRGLAGP